MVFIIGVAGGSGSGKTTFAHKVLKNFESNVQILHMDSYYLPEPTTHFLTKSQKPNFDHPGAFDWELLRNHITLLKSGQNICVPDYDFKSSRRKPTSTSLGLARVIIFEGIFSLYDSEIRNLIDLSCFLHVDADIRFIRRLHRDVKERGRSLESVIEQYYDSVRPMYEKFLSPQKQYADIIIGEETDRAASILSSKVKEILDSERVFTEPLEPLNA